MALPAFRDSFNLDHFKRGYYSIHVPNPTRLVPLGPELAWAPSMGVSGCRSRRLARRLRPRDTLENWSRMNEQFARIYPAEGLDLEQA